MELRSIAATTPPPSPAVKAVPTMPEGVVLPVLAFPGPQDPGTRHLPAPPEPGSAAARAELELLHTIQDHRTPAGDEWARRFDAHLGLDTWRSALHRLGERSGRGAEAKAAALLGAALVATAAVTAGQKRHFDRQRPFEVDPGIVPVVGKPAGSSYPSGHSSTGFAAARVLSRVDPDHAAEYYGLATQEALSRLYAGVHFPSDVVAGAALGTAIAEAVLRGLH